MKRRDIEAERARWNSAALFKRGRWLRRSRAWVSAFVAGALPKSPPGSSQGCQPGRGRAACAMTKDNEHLSNDVRDVYAEAKGNGFSTRALKHVIRIREYDREHGSDARRSEEAIIETYLNALGML